jgi:GTP pyrophosphokinase
MIINGIGGSTPPFGFPMTIYSSSDKTLQEIIAEDPVVNAAYNLAAKAHQKQKRRESDVPYITHPVRVANILLQDRSDTTSVRLAAALLHDVLEDTKVPIMEMMAVMGREITNLVLALTDEEPSRAHRINAILRMQTNPDAILIKMADRLANLEEQSGFTVKYRKKPDVRESTALLLGVAKSAGLDYTDTYQRLNDMMIQIETDMPI